MERETPKMSDGVNGVVETNENAPAHTRPATSNKLPLKVRVSVIGLAYVDSYS